MNTKKRGFTLTEVLVVVLIISVIAAIAYPLYTRSINKSRAMEAVNLLEIVRAKQIEHYARTRQYYNNFTDMGRLTGNLSAEVKNGATAKIKDYTLTLKEGQKCLTATYAKKGKNIFSFSSAYEQSGLGCTDETGGNFCLGFGDVVGTAESVCNCNGVTCGSGYSLNQNTCQCECLLGCAQGGSCYSPYGGGQTRSCSSMGGSATCGTQTSIDSCNGPVWTGTCRNPTQTQATSQSCGGGNGVQTRTCSASCTGGSCGSWGGCVCNSGYVWNGSTCVSATCDASTKPAETEACGKCGSRSRSVTCTTGAWVTGSWGACQNEGVCTAGSANCNSSCQCNSGYVASGGSCVAATCDASSKPAETQACGNCNKGTETRTVTCLNGAWVSGTWGACQGGGECSPGAAQACGNGGSQTCSNSCAWGSCSGEAKQCTEAKPDTEKNCTYPNYVCNKHKRTVTCNTTTGKWETGEWGACEGPSECYPGEKRNYGCPDKGTKWATCGSDCKMGEPEDLCYTSKCDGSATQSCYCGGTQTRSCNESTGQWSAWSECKGGQNPANPNPPAEACTFSTSIKYSYSSTYVNYSNIKGTTSRYWNRYTCSWQQEKCNAMIWVSLGQPIDQNQQSLCSTTPSCYTGSAWTYVGGPCNQSTLSRCSSSTSSSCYLYNCQRVFAP